MEDVAGVADIYNGQANTQTSQASSATMSSQISKAGTSKPTRRPYPGDFAVASPKPRAAYNVTKSGGSTDPLHSGIGRQKKKNVVLNEISSDAGSDEYEEEDSPPQKRSKV